MRFTYPVQSTNQLFFMITFALLSVSLKGQPLGVQLYTFRHEMQTDVPGTLEKISKMGIRVLEGGGLYGMEPQAFKQLLKKNNLSVVSVGADFNELDSNVQKAADRARLFNAKYVVCFWIPHPENEFGIEDVKKTIEVFNKAGKYLKERGLTFCYHAHGYEFRPYGQGTLFDELVKKTDAAYVNYEMDVFWVKQGGVDPVSLLKKYPNRFPLFHLKDRRIGTASTDNGQADEQTNVVLGEGDVNIKAIKKAASALKSTKYYFIEDESSSAMQQVPNSIAYWNKLPH
jgi:sugar phosphate isomerase/epimerase